MKKINLKYILSAILILLITSSCDNWLDVTASDEIRAEDQFETEAGFRDALIGAYVSMTDEDLYSNYMTYNVVDVLSQQYLRFTAGFAVCYDIQKFDYEELDAQYQIEAIWNKMYFSIANINSALKYMDSKGESILDPIEYSIIKGELLGLRAFLHFDLMRLFGHSNVAERSDISSLYAIPYVTEYTKDMTDQLSYDKTFELMLADIDEALELLKEDPIYEDPDRANDYYDVVNSNGFYDNRENRMNYYAVMALKARVLMWQGGDSNIAEAGTIAKTVIENSGIELINPDSYDLSNDPIMYSENIFNLNIENFEDVVDYYLTTLSGRTNYSVLYYSTTDMSELFETSNTAIGAVDLRYNTLLVTEGPGMVCAKLRQGATSGVNNDTHKNMMPLIKISEMYYIVAESDMKKASVDLPEAINYLNQVRASRGILLDIDSASDAETVTNEIQKEYRKEFLTEGQLFYYYKRNGLTSIPNGSSVEMDDTQYMLPFPDDELNFGRVQ